MRAVWTCVIPVILIALVLNVGCSKKNVEREGSKQITVTLNNNGPAAINLYLEGETVSANTLVQPGASRTSVFLATQVGHNVSVYAKLGIQQPALAICRVSQVSWDSQQAVVDWDGQNLACTTW